MDIKQVAETAELREKLDVISDEALDHAVGGLNPQPLPPLESGDRLDRFF